MESIVLRPGKRGVQKSYHYSLAMMIVVTNGLSSALCVKEFLVRGSRNQSRILLGIIEGSLAFWKSKRRICTGFQQYHDDLGSSVPHTGQHLSAKLVASHEKSLLNGYDPGSELTGLEATRLLEQRISRFDIQSAKDEVYPFVRDKDQLSLWSRDFFSEIAHRIRFVP